MDEDQLSNEDVDLAPALGRETESRSGPAPLLF